MGEDAYGINPKTIDSMVTEIAQVLSLGVEIAIVIGVEDWVRQVLTGSQKLSWNIPTRNIFEAKDL